MVYGAIVAGGIGSRMKLADMPKQFLPLGGKPIIIHTVEKFLKNDRLDYVYVGINGDWEAYFKELLKSHGIDSERLKVVCGGSDRNGTIMNIIASIHGEHGRNESDILVTHDAVRPFVTNRMINDNIEHAMKFGACDTAIPSTDTIATSEDGEFVAAIPNRNKMYYMQTPQSFNLNLLFDLYNDISEEQKAELTDACKIFILSGHKVSLVRGAVHNIKITTVSDYKIAEAILEGNLGD